MGATGKVEALLPEGTLRIGRRGQPDRRRRVDHVEDHRVAHVGLHHGSSYLEHVQLLAAIREGRPAEVTLDDGLWSVAMGVAAHRSIELGRPVRMDEVLPSRDAAAPSANALPANHDEANHGHTGGGPDDDRTARNLAGHHPAGSWRA